MLSVSKILYKTTHIPVQPGGVELEAGEIELGRDVCVQFLEEFLLCGLSESD